MAASRFPTYVLFAAAGLLAFFVATSGFDVLARVRLSNESLSVAFQKSLHYSSVQWVGTMLLAAPFLAAAILGAELTQRTTHWKGIALFVAVLTILGYVYLSGHWSAQQALVDGKWTAAALSVGLLPYVSIPIIIGACIAFGIIHWRHDRTHLAERRDV